MDNVTGVYQSPLLILGGFVSEVNDPSLPAGSAAVATDCDFTVASVKTRDGIQNVYVYDGSSETLAAQSGINITDASEEPWSNPENIAHDTMGTYASVALGLGGVAGTVTANSVSNHTPGGLSATAVTPVDSDGIVADDVLFAVVNIYQFGANPMPAISGIVDNLGDGNVWLPIGSPQTFTNNHSPPTTSLFQVYYAVAQDAVLPGVSFNVTASFSATCGTTSFDIVNFHNLVSLDQFVAASVAASPTFNLGPIVTTEEECIISIVAEFSPVGGSTVPTGWEGLTNPGVAQAQLAVFGTTDTYNAPAGSYSADWTINFSSPNNVGVLMSWKVPQVGEVVLDGSAIATSGGSTASSITLPTLTPTTSSELAIVVASGITLASSQPAWTPPGGWATFQNPTGVNGQGVSFFSDITGAISPTFGVSPDAYVAAVGLLLNASGQSIELTQQAYSGALDVSGPVTFSLVNPVGANSTLLLFIESCNVTGPLTVTGVSDDAGNIWNLVAAEHAGTTGGWSDVHVYAAEGVASGSPNVTIDFTGGQSGQGNAWLGEMQGGGGSGLSVSQILQAQGFGFTIPLNSSVLGVELTVKGKQSLTGSGDEIKVSVLNANVSVPIRTGQLAVGDGSFMLGAPQDGWGQDWTPAQVNAPGFGFGLQAVLEGSGPAIFEVSGVEATVWYTPPGLLQFDHITSFERTSGALSTLAIDNNGIWWEEDVLNNPGVLTPFFTAGEPNTFAVSVTLDDREFFALSDLMRGTDMPRGYDGTNVDRLSQVGPGAPPVIGSTSTGYDVVSITQPDARTIQGAQWNSGINSNSPGNTLTVYNSDADFLDGVMVGSVVYLQFTDVNFTSANGTYIVAATGQAFGMESGDGTLFNYISMTAPSTKFARSFNNSTGVGTVELTIATITLSAPVPNLSIGSSITLAGVSPSGWDGTWTVNGLVNGAILKITQTSLTSDVATYEFNLISGTTPTPGEFVTITGCTNGPVVSGQSIFNQFQAAISSVSPGQFTIFPVNADNVPPAAETTAVANVLGTEFTFDPGLGDVGTDNDPIIGTGTGGTLVIAGGLGAGLRQAVVMFLTRNQYLTAPSPPITFSLTEAANQITATNIPIGPPDVIARVIAFTGANGDFFYWLPTAQSIVAAGGQVINYTSTIINDNTSTEATFNFTDALLLAGEGIDDQGANQFALIELGSSTGLIAYADRLFAWGENNKVQNFINWSFDGGYIAQSSTTPLQPLGWTIDPTNGAGGSLVNSPLGGMAYQIQNTSGSLQAVYGMITQTAYQDYNKVPIINVQTTYSIRVTAETPNATASGNIVVDLFSPSFGASFGTYTLPISSLTATMSINIGTLLTTIFQTTVPADLLLRLYATNLPNGGWVLIDRIEPFPTEQPVLTTQLRGSYPENFEAFDGVTGNLGVGITNQQPVRNAFELFDNLYVVKTKSMVSTVDNGQTEPDLWTERTVSLKCGTPSIHGVDTGEGWAVIVNESGLYIFIGGEPVKISPELDGLGPYSSGTSAPGLWQSIRWKYGYTTWVKCSVEQRKIFIGVPLPTPNKWMPLFPANAAPTQPNVVLCLNFKELMTGSELQGQGPIRLSYTGELKSWPIGRKWSAWSIEACYADFIDRPDANGLDAPLFYCGDFGTGKIYTQIPGVYNDDGEALHWQYITYGFPKTSEAIQAGLGVNELQSELMTLTAVGAGELRFTEYPNSTDSPDQIDYDPEALTNPSICGDLEIPLNNVGNRFFYGFRLRDADEWAEISKVSIALTQNPWAPVRGSNN